MTPDDPGTPQTELGFAEALAELQGIVGDLESDALDVDRLTEQVRRAAALVAFCRDRIDGTRYAVTEVLAQLDGDPADAGADAGADGAADGAAGPGTDDG